MVMEEVRDPTGFVCSDIWEIVFGILDRQNDTTQLFNSNRSDLYNCSQACVTFQNILNPSRTTWLFREIIPFLFYYLDGSSVRTCRGACMEWKRAVDSFLENEHDFRNAHYENGTLLPIPLYSFDSDDERCKMFWGTHKWKCTIAACTIRLYSGAQITKFFQDFSEHPGNPFPGKSLHLANPVLEDEYDQHWNGDVIQLLCRFGDCIHNLHLNISQNEQPLYSISNIISNCLKLTPNLKRFRVTGMFLDHDDETVLPLAFDEEAKFPPPFPQLMSLGFRTRNFIPPMGVPPLSLETFFANMYSRQLKEFHSVLTTPQRNDLPYTACGTMKSLVQLRVKVTDQKSPALLASSFSPDTTYSALRAVVIEIANGQHQLGDYLSTMQIFKGSLKSLHIFVDSYCHLAKVSESELEMLADLDNLEYLHIDGFKFCNVDIANCLPPKLKYLVLEWMEEYCHKGNKMTFGCAEWRELLGPGVSKDLPDEKVIYESKIWERMPRLRWISVTYCKSPILRYFYRRENWEMWVQGKGKGHVGVWDVRLFRLKRWLEDVAKGARDMKRVACEYASVCCIICGDLCVCRSVGAPTVCGVLENCHCMYCISNFLQPQS